jgi:hypothetical protein
MCRSRTSGSLPDLIVARPSPRSAPKPRRDRVPKPRQYDLRQARLSRRRRVQRRSGRLGSASGHLSVHGVDGVTKPIAVRGRAAARPLRENLVSTPAVPAQGRPARGVEARPTRPLPPTPARHGRTETAMIAKNTIGLEHLPEHASVRLRRVHGGIRPGHRSHPRGDGGRRTRLTRPNGG